ncbi:pyrimidine utilization protein D [Pseudochelatococcus contaminans]|uniref:Putative carbamate hydrolase RutD n=1 Tax=Pseudochelatococcus contaminans TaxID=1538103 RepID=A0A7W5Z5Y0_9HYPH|nr:pyrimidine utilization protein D [Pseudochelatococcus contaminans]MBB3810302.1 aminoacrylate hydrolase [Pseudochelatococcus contaminans]
MHVDITGQTGENAPTVLLSSGLGGAGAYWTPQTEALGEHFRILTYDHRGTGLTGGEVPETGGIGAMADDVLGIARRHGLSQFDFVGHALGGLIGLHLALHHPDLVRRLVLINAWSAVDAHTERCFDVRIDLLKHAGVAAFVRAQPLFLYPAAWMADNPQRLSREEAHALAHFQGQTNLLRRIEALRAFDIDAQLHAITTPALVIATQDDLLVPHARSLHLAQGLPNARLALLPRGGHAVNVTQPDLFNRLLIDFLTAPDGHDIEKAATHG